MTEQITVSRELLNGKCLVDISLLRQVLELLKKGDTYFISPAGDLTKPTIAALREALEQPAPQIGVGNSGFDHKTAADFLSGKEINDESVRRFVAASRWAHDDRASLQALVATLRQDIAARDAEIALLKQSLLDAEALEQPAVEPAGVLHRGDGGAFRFGFPSNLKAIYALPKGDHELYAAPQARTSTNVKQDPQATVHSHFVRTLPNGDTEGFAFATSPEIRPPQLLTDEEIAQAWACGEHNASAVTKRRVSKAIEQAVLKKNGVVK